MTDQEFGQVALQLLSAATISGGSLDIAVTFRERATALAEGRVQMTENAGGPLLRVQSATDT